jgi:hypothetical protein
LISNIERRLRQLEQHSAVERSEVFIIYGCDDRSEDDLREHFGIRDKPGRELQVMLISYVGKDESGQWGHVGYGAIGHEGWLTEPLLDNFGPPCGPRRNGSEWVREC